MDEPEAEEFGRANWPPRALRDTNLEGVCLTEIPLSVVGLACTLDRSLAEVRYDEAAEYSQ